MPLSRSVAQALRCPSQRLRAFASRARQVLGQFRWDTTIKLENALLSARSKRQLIIYDDAFPHLLTSFRICEYNRYLQEFGTCIVHTTGTSFAALGEFRGFPAVLQEYEAAYPEFKNRVRWFDRRRRLHAELLYAVFLQNAHAMLAIAHRDDVPFVITLYPGGGFRLNEPESDRQLRAVCSSPNLKKVIATQRVTRDYLLERGFCRPDQVKFIYGGVFPADRLAANHPRKLYGQNKNTFDICFVAHKYMPHGIDKGYDVFVQVAERLVNYGDIRFHVAGPFGPNDLDVSRLGEKIRFWGPQTTGFFPRFYAEMDLILAPNVPFVLFPGAFDGFPTGACIEAGIAGVGVFGTDPLNQNIAFKDGQEIVIVPRDADAIGEIICTYYRDYDRLRELCCRGQEAFRRVFDVDRQMAPRLRLLNKFASAGAAGRQARLLAMPLPSRDVPE